MGKKWRKREREKIKEELHSPSSSAAAGQTILFGKSWPPHSTLDKMFLEKPTAKCNSRVNRHFTSI